MGRQAAAGTDIKLNAQILTYARSKGAFAGVSLDGAVVQADQSGDRAMYGANVTCQEKLLNTRKNKNAKRGPSEADTGAYTNGRRA